MSDKRREEIRLQIGIKYAAVIPSGGEFDDVCVDWIIELEDEIEKLKQELVDAKK